MLLSVTVKNRLKTGENEVLPGLRSGWLGMARDGWGSARTSGKLEDGRRAEVSTVTVGNVSVTVNLSRQLLSRTSELVNT